MKRTGIFFISGHLQLETVYNNYRNETHDYEVVFVGTPSSFSTQVADRNLSELDLSAYDHALTYANIAQSWQADGHLTGSTGGFFQGDILYPLVEWGYTYDENNRPIESTVSALPAAGASSNSFLQVAHPLDIQQMKPSIRAKALWDQIFLEAGYEYESNFLSSAAFRNLYILSDSEERSFIKLLTKFKAELNLHPNSFNTAYVDGDMTYNLLNIVSDPNRVLNQPGGYFQVPVTGLYTFVFTGGAITNWSSQSPFVLTYKVMDDMGGVLYSVGINVPAAVPQPNLPTIPGYVPPMTLTTSVGLTAGSRITFHGEIPSGTNLTQAFPGYTGGIEMEMFLWQCAADPSTTIVRMGSLLSENTKQIDFIKSIIKKFKLKLIPSRTQMVSSSSNHGRIGCSWVEHLTGQPNWMSQKILSYRPSSLGTQGKLSSLTLRIQITLTITTSRHSRSLTATLGRIVVSS